MRMQVEVAARTDIGIVRKNNEDNYGFDTRLGIFVLCDGMGGQAAGEVASRLAVETVLGYFREAKAIGSFVTIGEAPTGVSMQGRAVASAINLANTAVFEAGSSNAARAGMGSTIVAAYVAGNLVTIAHVGDSRAYLFRAGTLRQLTMDHSLVMEQLRKGYITTEQAEHSELQNIITRALGHEQTVAPDVQDVETEDGDILLIACDGLTKAVSGDRIRSILSGEKSLEQAATRLIETAKENKSDDNITCLVLRILKRPWYALGSQARRSEGPV